MEHAAAARDVSAFSVRLLRNIASRDGPRAANLAVSPLSLHAALVLLGAGARGATLDQIVAFLGPAGGPAHAALASHVALHMLSGDRIADAAGGPTVRFANGIWVDLALRLKDAYARVTAEHYRAEASPAPFKSRPEEVRLLINQWIESATTGRIKDLLPPGSIHSGTPAVLANALYFKGTWERKFDASLTQDGAFYLPAGGHVRVPFMSSTRKQRIASRAGYKVLRLPYSRGGADQPAFSMYVYLPDARDGLSALLQRLSSDPSSAAPRLESSATLADEVPVRAFRVPRFAVSCNTRAAAALRELGLALPFDPVRADFGDMVESAPEPLVVSEVYHECFVEVDEEGTEAAAATATVMTFGCACPPPPEDFVADHPFMFLIQEDVTGVVVFAGQVTDPSVSR
ncbi:unnamed protein product [Urochloa decumbens]|uniref:Serpin domain-containing protein n=1 Tax=Urochloa decumbens TaxID=240449 RepID=A0ABC9A915_9POAL